MTETNTDNVVGALALMLADDLLGATAVQAPEMGLAAAALALLGHEPGMSIEKLRRALGLSHPGAVRLVDRLERQGQLSRKPGMPDRRAVSLQLTAKGRKSVKTILAARQSSLSRALDTLTPAERRQFGNLACKVLRAALRDEAHAYTVCRLCDPEACEDCPVEDELLQRASAD